MYQLPEGERTLEGAEAKLIKMLIHYTWDNVEMDREEKWEFGIGTFDRLTIGQQLSVFVTVAEALLLKSTPPPRLTAVVEGAIAALFKMLDIAIEMDMDFDPPLWRPVILEVYEQEAEISEPTLFVMSDDDDIDEWKSRVDSIANRFFYDEDFMDEAIYEGKPWLQEDMDIEDDYFSSKPTEPSEEEFEKLEARLLSLVADDD